MYNIMSLFRRVAQEVSRALDYKYSIIADQKATQWVENNLVIK